MKRKTFLFFALMAAIAVIGFGSCLTSQGYDSLHNARNSLDWEGTYTGIIPSASGMGIDTRLKLNADQSYELSTTYVGRSDGPYNKKGLFSWNNKGSVITLDYNDGPHFYKVVENKLIQLDMKGKEIKGILANDYILTKER